MKKPKVAIWGAGAQGMIAGSILRLVGSFEIVGFLDDQDPERKGSEFNGHLILGGREELDGLRRKGVSHILLAVGLNHIRSELANLIQSLGFEQASAIHPQSVLPDEKKLGSGILVKAGVFIDPDVQLGNNVMISSGVCVGHGTLLEDGSRLSTGAQVGSDCHIGSRAWVAMGGIIKPGVKVGQGALVGMGSVVLEDVSPDSVVFGNPARYSRPTKQNEV